MHLKFLDTSPLKVFAFCLRCRHSWSVCRQLGTLVDLNVVSELREDSRKCVSFVDTASTNGARVSAVKRKLNQSETSINLATNLIRTQNTAKRKAINPPTISFRVTNKTWFRIAQEVAETDLTPHDWCRMAVLDRLDHDYGFSKKERLLLHQIVRMQYFVAFGFQMLADNTLTTAEWKKMRTYAKEKADYLAKRALTDFRSWMESRS
jgi:hypothetical protein